MLNATYAHLAERADALDRAELQLTPYASDEAKQTLCGHRDELDKWLSAATGEEAEYERAVLKYLTN